jgi:predicted acylesterase/phospholipase RssA
LTRIANPELFENGVNLALGGGGAKGFVHLGVIEELARLGIEIKAIVGTSIGAIIGALFAHFSTSMFRDEAHPQLAAAGAVRDLFLRENFWKYADWNKFSPFTAGLLRGETISDWLAAKLYDPENARYVRFRDVKFPLTVTATDAHTGECLIINCGKDGSMFVHRAVRASMSIQWVFREIVLEVDGKPHRCWDGGSTGNCRFDVANRIYPGRPTIASSLTYRGEIVETHSSYLGSVFRPYQVLSHTTSIMMRAVEQALREAMPAEERQNTTFLEPRLEYSSGGGRVETFDFNLKREYREELVENGRLVVREKLCSPC